MAPEFAEGDVIVIEPDGLATERRFVLARHDGRMDLPPAGRLGRRLAVAPPEPALPVTVDLADLSAVRGVVIQRTTPGNRKSTTRYGE